MLNFRAPLNFGGGMNPQSPVTMGAGGMGAMMTPFGGRQGYQMQPQMAPQGLPNVSQMAAAIGGLQRLPPQPQAAAPMPWQGLGQLGGALLERGWGGLGRIR